MGQINDDNWDFLHDATGLSKPFNDMYFRYLRDQGYTGSLQDMIAKSGLGLDPKTPVWAKGTDLWQDFTANDELIGGSLTDTHAQTIYAPNTAGTYSPFAANVITRTNLGLQTVPTRTNKCTNFNANPTNTTNVGTSGDPAATLTIVDDVTALAAAGLSAICTSGKVYKLDNTAGVGNAFASPVGQAGNTNVHTVSCYVRGSGTAKVVSAGGAGYTALTASYVRRIEQPTVGTTAACQIGATPGSIVYFILNQLEEAAATYATPPIVTEGSAVTRNGNIPIISGLGSALTTGVAGFIKFDAKAIELLAGATILGFNDGTDTNRVKLEYASTGQMRWQHTIAGVGTTGNGLFPSGPLVPYGQTTVAFAFSAGFQALRAVGQAQVSNTLAWPVMDRLTIGSRGTTASSNVYQHTQKIGLKFGPQNQASFDAMYARALLA